MPSLLNCDFFLNNGRTKFVTVFLNEYFIPHVRIVTSTHSVVLSPTTWFTLMSFKTAICRNFCYQLDASHQFFCVHSNRSVQITCNGSYVLLSKGQWNTLLHLGTSNINAQILQLFEV